jgi:hypothetical protein
VVVVPLHGFAHSPIVSVIDRLSSFPRYVRLLPELVEEYVKAFSFIFSQGYQTMIQR